MKRIILAGMVISLIMAVYASAVKPPKGVPGQPTKPTITKLADPNRIFIDWSTGTATSAVKWTVDIEGTISFDDGGLDGDGDGRSGAGGYICFVS